MLINLRDNRKKLVVKNILDIDFDMSVEQEGNKYYIEVNSIYRLDECFESQNDAEEKMLHIANVRNTLEAELSSYS